MPADDASDPLADLARTLGHDFAHPALLVEALTHPSALNRPHRGPPPPSYQRLEFLGDRVLGLVVADLLWRRFPDEAEGHLTRRHVHLVRRETLATVAAALDLGRHVILSRSEQAAGGAASPAILADACEAVIAAIYLDGGFAAAADFVRRFWEPLIEAMTGPPRDPKTALQEWAQARGLAPPAYRVEASGPDHALQFTATARLAGFEPATATGSSKRHAEAQAAARLLETVAASAR